MDSACIIGSLGSLGNCGGGIRFVCMSCRGHEGHVGCNDATRCVYFMNMMISRFDIGLRVP